MNIEEAKKLLLEKLKKMTNKPKMGQKVALHSNIKISAKFRNIKNCWNRLFF